MQPTAQLEEGRRVVRKRAGGGNRRHVSFKHFSALISTLFGNYHIILKTYNHLLYFTGSKMLDTHGKKSW